MIGVILWSDPVDKKAVIWCEDHGDLAYLSRNSDAEVADRFFDVGDVVEFEVKTERNLRLAGAVQVLEQAKAAELVDDLKSLATEPEHATSGQIIPFRLEAPVRRFTDGDALVQRRG